MTLDYLIVLTIFQFFLTKGIDIPSKNLEDEVFDHIPLLYDHFSYLSMAVYVYDWFTLLNTSPSAYEKLQISKEISHSLSLSHEFMSSFCQLPNMEPRSFGPPINVKNGCYFHLFGEKEATKGKKKEEKKSNNVRLITLTM